MEIWKSDILILTSKDDYLSLFKTDQVGPFDKLWRIFQQFILTSQIGLI